MKKVNKNIILVNYLIISILIVNLAIFPTTNSKYYKTGTLVYKANLTNPYLGVNPTVDGNENKIELVEIREESGVSTAYFKLTYYHNGLIEDSIQDVVEFVLPNDCTVISGSSTLTFNDEAPNTTSNVSIACPLDSVKNALTGNISLTIPVKKSSTINEYIETYLYLDLNYTQTLIGYSSKIRRVAPTPVIVKPVIIEPIVELSETEYVYTGEEITPEIIVKNGEEVLSVEEYDVEYINNVLPGEATVIVTSKGEDYTFEDITINFVIDKLELNASELEVTVNEETLVYTGEVIVPTIKNITYNEISLDIAYFEFVESENIDAGEATYVLRLINDELYANFVEKEIILTIQPKEIQDVTVMLDELEFSYTGELITTKVIVKSEEENISKEEYNIELIDTTLDEEEIVLVISSKEHNYIFNDQTIKLAISKNQYNEENSDIIIDEENLVDINIEDVIIPVIEKITYNDIELDMEKFEITTEDGVDDEKHRLILKVKEADLAEETIEEPIEETDTLVKKEELVSESTNESSSEENNNQNEEEISFENVEDALFGSEITHSSDNQSLSEDNILSYDIDLDIVNNIN